MATRAQRVLSQIPVNVKGQEISKKVAANPKKRRAAFEDITNDGKQLAANKKKCVKQDVALLKAKVSAAKISQSKEGSVYVLLDPKSAISTTAALEKVPVAEKLGDDTELCRDAEYQSSQDTQIDIDDSTSDSTEIEQNQKDDSDIDSQINELCERLDWIDVDKENENIPFYVTDYVNDIFDYYKERERQFVVSDYMSKQQEMTVAMRAILVDWMDEVQQNFELNHETLYLAVKLVDLYLVKTNVAKDRLQLLGATALNVACKFEERCPPVLDDYLFICDDAYNREEILEMERNLLKAVDFDIGLPLSYTFLRRYAQCGRVSIKTLTCARFILEMSLMEYSYVECIESKMASACLLLAMRMNEEGEWDGTMIHYAGYSMSELAPLARSLNEMLISPSQKSLGTIKNKYSHEVFHEVAKIPPLTEDELSELLSNQTH